MQNDIYCAPDASYSELPAGPSSTCSVCVSRKDFSHDSLGLDANSPASEMFSHRLVGYPSHVPILPYAPSISRPPRGLYAPFQLNNPAYPRGGRALFSLSPDVHRYSLPVNQETAKECAEHDLQTKRTLQTSATMSSYSEASVSDWEKSNGKRTQWSIYRQQSLAKMYLRASAKTILSVDNKNSSTSHVINYEKNQLGLENSQIIHLLNKH